MGANLSSLTAASLHIEYQQQRALHPVAYFSKKLTDTQSLYGAQERELLAILMALLSWRHWVEGVDVTIIPDDHEWPENHLDESRTAGSDGPIPGRDRRRTAGMLKRGLHQYDLSTRKRARRPIKPTRMKQPFSKKRSVANLEDYCYIYGDDDDENFDENENARSSSTHACFYRFLMHSW